MLTQMQTSPVTWASPLLNRQSLRIGVSTPWKLEPRQPTGRALAYSVYKLKSDNWMKLLQYLWPKCQYAFGVHASDEVCSVSLNLLSYNCPVAASYYIKIRSTWRWRYDFCLLYIHLTLGQNYCILYCPTQCFFSPFTGKKTQKSQGSRAALRHTQYTLVPSQVISAAIAAFLSPHCLLTFLVHKQRSITAPKLLTLHINEILAKVSLRFLFYNILNRVISRQWYPWHNAQFHRFSVLLSIWRQ